MSAGAVKKRYTSAMEKIIKNAVSETSKVLETIIAEMKGEVLRVKSENENLKIRCSQFEEVVKKRTVYRETGTSPEPYIIEKCDKAVQCELALQQPEGLDPNLSDNETQSERSFGIIHEKESSNDSFSFTKVTEDESNNFDPLDVSDKTTSEKSFDQETNTNDDRLEQNKMESDRCLETPTCSSEQEIVTTISSPPVELYEEHEICCEISEMEIQETCQEDVGIECATMDDSLLECQDEDQKVLKERTTISLQEDVPISMEKDGLIIEKSKPKECEDRPFPDVSNEIAQQQVVRETSKMNVETDLQSKLSSSEMKPDNAFSADKTNTELGNILALADDYDVSSVQAQQITPPTVISAVTPTGPEQSSANINGRAVQSLSTHVSSAKKAQKTSPTLKYPYFLRRQRHSSVTLEDAMLLLDAVNLHEYKSPTIKKNQTKHSLRPFSTSKIGKSPEVTPTDAEDCLNLEEKASITETLLPLAPQMAEVIEEACPAIIVIEGQQHDQETTPHTKSSLEAVIDHGVVMVTSTKLTLVTETDSVSMDIEEKHLDDKILSSPTKQSTTPSMTDMNVTTAKQGEPTAAVDNDAANLYIESQAHDLMAATSDEPDQNVTIEPPSMTSIIQSEQDENVQEVEVIECPAEMDIDSQNSEYKSWSLIPSTRTSHVAPGADDHAALLSTPTEQGETAQATADFKTQNDLDNLMPPSLLPSEPLTLSESDPTQANPDETDSVAQISGLPTLHTEGQENNFTLSLAPSPSKPPTNPVMQHTLLLKMPGETGDLCSSVLKTITSSSTLSPAQLSAVVSAVRSTQNTSSSTGQPQSLSSGKKLVAVPFSLQSVMKPHHKIIVIPRQCKVPPSHAIAKDKGIVLKKNPYELDATTTVISTSDVNLEPCCSVDTTPELDKQQPALENTSPAQEKSPCKNNVQVKLSRLPFPVMSVQTVSVTNVSPDKSSTTQQNAPPVRTIIPETPSKLPEAQPAEENLTSPVIDSSPKLSNKRNKPVQTSPRRKVKSNIRSRTIVRLSPVVSNDHSYPQNRMTKSQFLAKLEVSPVTQDSEKAGSSSKELQKASLVDRLRSHLKKVQDGSSLTVQTPDRIPITQETGSNQEQQSENVILPDTVLLVDENKSIQISPIKTSPDTKSVAKVRQVKRKNCPKVDTITPTKPVKKCRLKKSGASCENIPLRGNLSPMRNKLINSNALLSCVRKGLTKKSFLCKFCRKEFSKKKDIEEHIQVHAGKKPFQCNICHRRFSKTIELSRHLKRHNAEKKYHCSICGKAFIEYNNLKRHTYVHTGEKPFTCPHCPKSFTQSGHMRTHIKSYHKDIKR